MSLLRFLLNALTSYPIGGSFILDNDVLTLNKPNKKDISSPRNPFWSVGSKSVLSVSCQAYLFALFRDFSSASYKSIVTLKISIEK